MKQKLLCFFMLGILLIGSAYAQERRISGSVTAADDGSPIEGATVVAVGTNTSVQTESNGTYSIVVPSGATELEFRFLGYFTQRVALTSSSIVNVSLVEDATQLEEVIVTGVAAATSVKKLTVSVTKVGAADLSGAKPTSVSTALAGKVAGLQSSLSQGRPGVAADIMLRADGNLNNVGSSPLIVIDGMIMRGSMADINIDDVESIEVVKGAAAAALYGSRAGNGVIAITTKRGTMGVDKPVSINVRNEFGRQTLPTTVSTPQAHPYKLAPDWEQYKGQYTKYDGVTYPQGYTGAGFHPGISGSRVLDDDAYVDNPYGVTNDLQRQLFRPGPSMTNYIALSTGSERSNLYGSFENHKTEGIVRGAEGYSRQNFRVNYDLQVFDWLKFNTSNLFINRATKQQGDGSNVFYYVLTAPPDVDFFQENPDGQPYYLRINHNNAETTNPLYNLYKNQPEDKSRRWLGNFAASIKLTEWASVDVNHSMEVDNYRWTSYQPKDTWGSTGGTPETMGMSYTDGSLSKTSTETSTNNTQATINLGHTFNDLIVNARLSYLYEDRHWETYNANASQFALHDVPNFNNFTLDRYRASSSSETERAQNYFAILSLDYKDRYLFDGMYRYDGSSLFGPDSRWNSYYRISGAYRISEDVSIPGVDEMKVRAAHGTAGIRPGYSWQYTYYSLSGGSSSATQTGNTALKPSKTTETEVGFNIDFLNRFSFEAVYAFSETTDQFVNASLIPFLNNGYNRQWRNAGTIETNTFEATFGARWYQKEDFSWRTNLTFTRNTQKVTDLPIPPYIYGSTDGGAAAAFYVRSGEVYGAMYGYRFVETLDQMSNQLPAGASISDYEVNSHGYVVPFGSQGTSDERVIELLDDSGNKVFERIGDGNPDFFMGIANTLNYKGFGLYLLLDYKQGGSIYNGRRQWLTFSNANPDMDMSNVAPDQKKTVAYFQSLYNRNDPTAHWVEDGTYLKVRELALSYSVPRQYLNFANNTFKGATIALIGRNLFTFTNYTGYDPEVGSIRQPYEATMRYPNFRSISASLSLDF